MENFDLIFNPYKNRKKILLKALLILLVLLITTTVFLSIYANITANHLLKISDLLIRIDKEVYSQIPLLVLSKNSLERIYNEYGIYKNELKSYISELNKLSHFYSWTGISDKLKKMYSIKNSMKTAPIEKMYLLSIKILERKIDIQNCRTITNASQGQNINDFQKKLQNQRELLTLLDLSINDAQTIETEPLAHKFLTIDGDLSYELLKKQREIEENFELSISSKLSEVKHDSQMSNNSNRIFSQRHSTTGSERSQGQGLLGEIYDDLKDAFIGESRSRAIVLSGDLRIDPIEKEVVSGRPYEFYLTVRNVSQQIAMDVSVFVFVNGMLGAVKLKSVDQIQPGSSEQFFFNQAAAPSFPGESKIKLRVIWGNGFYNDASFILHIVRGI